MTRQLNTNLQDYAYEQTTILKDQSILKDPRSVNLLEYDFDNLTILLDANQKRLNDSNQMIIDAIRK